MSALPPFSHSPAKLKIGIVGFGPFAQFLAKTMINQGHTLRATSRTNHSEICEQMGVSFFCDADSFVEADNEVILICTSILSLAEVLQLMPLHRLRPPVVIVDVLSVKEFPRQILLQVLPEEASIVCTHPMFGPESGKNGWKGLTFVYEKVRVRDEVTCSNFLQIFKTEGCKMLEMSCQEHDELAAKSQFLTHTIGRIMAEADLKSTAINTKGYETLLNLRESTMKDSFDLFSGLFVKNRFAKQELENLEYAFGKVKQKLLERLEEEEEAEHPNSRPV